MVVSAEELEALVLENQRLIYWCLKPYKDFKNSRYDYDDLVQVAHEAFIKAIEDYDESKGKLSTFVAIRIPSMLGKFVRKNISSFTVPTNFDYATIQTPTTVSLSIQTTADGHDLEGTVGRPDDNLEMISLLSAVEKICHSFRFDGNEVFRQWKLWRLWGYTQQEIADFYGVERAVLWWRLKTIEKKLMEQGVDT